MRLDDFDFDLPADRIAQQPARPRDSARLLAVMADGVADRSIRDLPDLLLPGDLMVVNDTRVLPVRLRGRRGEAKVEVTLHKAEGAGQWRAYARPAKRLALGDRLDFGALAAEVTAKGEGGDVTLDFDRQGEALMAALEAIGTMPLPPYIRRAGPDVADRADYQTVFAARPGAVAAPTAGLHFTPTLLAALGTRGVGLVTVTLHVGAGTFLPVRSERVEEHRMHAEWGEVGVDAAAAINRTRAGGGRIVAVGTTALRVLESAVGDDGAVRPFSAETDIFILPGYRFNVVDRLLTNFHLPKSTLFMLVSAFAGTARMKAAYAHAIAAGYRFYSYGDACLLEREA